MQWASRFGARVIATASNEADATTCRDAGAHEVVNHRDERFARAILDANDGKLVDRVVDVEFGANLAVSIEVLRTGGTIATYASMQVPEPTLPFFQMMYKDLTVRMIIVYAMPDHAKDHAIADINSALSQTGCNTESRRRCLSTRSRLATKSWSAARFGAPWS